MLCDTERNGAFRRLPRRISIRATQLSRPSAKTRPRGSCPYGGTGEIRARLFWLTGTANHWGGAVRIRHFRRFGMARIADPRAYAIGAPLLLAVVVYLTWSHERW